MEDSTIKALHDSVASLAHRHATVSYLLIGVLVLVLGLTCAGGYFGLKAFNEQAAKANAAYAQYAADRKADAAQIATLQQSIKYKTAQQSRNAVETVKEDKAADKKIADVTAPTAQPNQVVDDVQDAYKFTGVFYDPSNSRFSFNQAQVQTMTATKIDRDRLFNDLNRKQSDFDLEHGKFLDLQTQNAILNGRVQQAEGVIKDYRDAIHPGKWKAFFNGAGRVLELGAVGLLSYEAGAHHK